MRKWVLLLWVVSSSLFASVEVTLLKVIDGDTLRVRYQGKAESVRLLGIDAPESRRSSHLSWQEHHWHQSQSSLLSWGHHVKTSITDLLANEDVVILEFDQQKRDHYGRSSYVFLKMDANEWILSEGGACAVILQIHGIKSD